MIKLPILFVCFLFFSCTHTRLLEIVSINPSSCDDKMISISLQTKRDLSAICEELRKEAGQEIGQGFAGYDPCKTYLFYRLLTDSNYFSKHEHITDLGYGEYVDLMSRESWSSHVNNGTFQSEWKRKPFNGIDFCNLDEPVYFQLEATVWGPGYSHSEALSPVWVCDAPRFWGKVTNGGTACREFIKPK